MATRAEVAKRRAAAQKAWAYRLKAVYGITVEEYEAIKAAQGGVCYICRRANGRTVRLSVDHDHATGLIRGLLCKACNTFLGRQARDNWGAFVNGQVYLVNPPARAVIGERVVPGFVSG